jgi:choline dehydrogenase-like flavoprotein
LSAPTKLPRYELKSPVDFLIIGAGAAGSVVAKELSAAGFQVVVLEQGPYIRPEQFVHDELRFKDPYNAPHIGREVLTNDHSLQPNTFRSSVKEKAVRQPAVVYGKCVGGGPVHFTANYWRLHEVDFIERSRWGPIAGTGFSDWPITYADLEPYYTKAEWELGISGKAGASPFDPPRSKPYPLPPMPVKSSGVLLERGARKLGLHPFPAPVAVISEDYHGRNGCHHCGFCEWFGCEWGAKSSPLSTVIPMAEATGRCEIRPHSYVRRISVDKRGRADGVIYFDARRREHFQRAKAVVLCANGAESPRLLLMSESSLFPHGLANSSGLVGKYLMFDQGAVVQGTFEHELNDFKSVQVSRIVHDFYDADPKRGFYGGGGIDGRFDFYPIGFALGALPPGTPRWGAGFKRALQTNFTRTMTSISHTTTLPLESNNVTLDPDLKDAWGEPAIRVTYQCHPDDLENMKFFSARALEIMEAAGALQKWAYPVGSPAVGVHLLGTCRMGSDPKSSVVDKYHRAHDVPNLFIVSGGSMVSSGRNQPTCTIQALAYRASEYMARAAKAGDIPSQA